MSIQLFLAKKKLETGLIIWIILQDVTHVFFIDSGIYFVVGWKWKHKLAFDFKNMNFIVCSNSTGTCNVYRVPGYRESDTVGWHNLLMKQSKSMSPGSSTRSDIENKHIKLKLINCIWPSSNWMLYLSNFTTWL